MGPAATAPPRAAAAVARAARALQARGRTNPSTSTDWRGTWIRALLIRGVLGHAPTRALVAQAIRSAAAPTGAAANGHARAADAANQPSGLGSSGKPPTGVAALHAEPAPAAPIVPRARPMPSPSGPGDTVGPARQHGRAEVEPPAGAWAPWLADAQPTAFAGLPMLLTVLGALGMERWLQAQEPELAQVFARAFLGHVADRLGMAGTDAMRAPLALAAEESAAFAAGTTRWTGFGWPAWSDAPLPPRARLSAPEALAPWRVAARRALRLHAGIGIASLCRRRGRVATQATHVDVTLPMDAADLRVRRSGLDRDPGWVPWFGRIVAFHYADADVPRQGADRA
jgi:hypothetical protein